MRNAFIVLFLVLAGLALLAQLWALALGCAFVVALLVFATTPEGGERRSVLLDPSVNIGMSLSLGLAVIAGLLLESERFLAAGVLGALAGFAGMITAYFAWRRTASSRS